MIPLVPLIVNSWPPYPHLNAPVASHLDTRRNAALTFLSAVYADTEGHIALSEPTNRGWRTKWFRTDQLEEAAGYATHRTTDTYIGVGLRAQPVKGRGKTQDIIGLPAFYMDLDIQHPTRRRSDLPPDVDAALALLADLPPPSLLVHSGYGLQPWWLFREVWTFDRLGERDEAQRLLEEFQNIIHTYAERHGWRLDKTADLPRVLRMPGTFNHKVPNNPAPISLLFAGEARYNPSDFVRYMPRNSLSSAENSMPSHTADPLSTAPIPLGAIIHTNDQDTTFSLSLLSTTKEEQGACQEGNKQHSQRVSLASIPRLNDIGGLCKQLYHIPENEWACAKVLGIIETQLNRAFRCVLPGHSERRPSAALTIDPKGGGFTYWDNHYRSGDKTYTLPAVYAAQVSGLVRRLSKPSTFIWRLRLLIAAGVIPPAHVPYPPLTEAVNPTVKAAYEGFILLLQCRWLDDPDNPAPFSRGFAAAWCGLIKPHLRPGVDEERAIAAAEKRAEEAIHWLTDAKYLEVADYCPGHFGKAKLYLIVRQLTFPGLQ